MVELSDTHLSTNLTEMITYIENAVKNFKPDIIFTHSNIDHHQDHISVYNASIAALRAYNGTILLYPSTGYVYKKEYNLFVDITAHMNRKLKILESFESQAHNWYFDAEYIKSTAQQLGARFGFKYAEGFQLYSAVN